MTRLLKSSIVVKSGKIYKTIAEENTAGGRKNERSRDKNSGNPPCDFYGSGKNGV